LDNVFKKLVFFAFRGDGTYVKVLLDKETFFNTLKQEVIKKLESGNYQDIIS